MTGKDVRFSGRELVIGGRRVELEHEIRSAQRVGKRIIVLYNSDVYWRNYGKPQTGQFHNLVAIDSEGKVEWVAELPSTYPDDSYVSVSSYEPLVVWAWSLYDCTIDPDTGRIVSKVWVK